MIELDLVCICDHALTARLVGVRQNHPLGEAGWLIYRGACLCGRAVEVRIEAGEAFTSKKVKKRG